MKSFSRCVQSVFVNQTPQPTGGEEMQWFCIVPEPFQPSQMKLSKQIDVNIPVKVANLLEWNTTALELHFDSGEALAGSKRVC